MKYLSAADSQSYATQSTSQLRAAFLLTDLFVAGEVVLRYWETDRAVIGGIIPTDASLPLTAAADLRANYFCERREVGIVNTGAPGTVTVDGVGFPMNRLDVLYIGRGAREITFSSANSTQPARYYLLSYPAHTAYPTTLARYEAAKAAALGAAPTANERRLTKVIHPDGIKSCQLVLGFTLVQTGSVWNTMPPHTHARRSEVYLYIDVPENNAVMHFMGRPDETRHLVVRDHEAVLSPPWSIHSGAGTTNYGFIWGMGGENQDFVDMDPAPISTLA